MILYGMIITAIGILYSRYLLLSVSSVVFSVRNCVFLLLLCVFTTVEETRFKAEQAVRDIVIWGVQVMTCLLHW